MAEKFVSWSPYVYCFNNPVNFVDPDGMDPDPKNVLMFIGNDYSKKDIELFRKTLGDNWTVYREKNVDDAHSTLSKHTGGESSLDNLVLIGHGSTKGGKISMDMAPIGEQSMSTQIGERDVQEFNDFGDKVMENPPPLGLEKSWSERKTVNGDYIGDKKLNAVKSLDAFGDYMNPDTEGGSNIIFGACNAGQGIGGDALGHGLNQLYEGNTNVYLNSNLTSPRIDGASLKLNSVGGYNMFSKQNGTKVPLQTGTQLGGVQLNANGKPFTIF